MSKEVECRKKKKGFRRRQRAEKGFKRRRIGKRRRRKDFEQKQKFDVCLETKKKK